MSARAPCVLIVHGSMAELFQIPPPDSNLPVACPGSGFLGCVLSDGPADALVRSFLADRVRRWARWDEVRHKLAAGGVSDLVVSGEAWRRHGTELWSRLSARRILVARRPRAAYRDVLVAAESVAGARDLVATLQERVCAPSQPVQLIHAVQPSTWLLMAGAMAGTIGASMYEDGFAGQVAAGAEPLGAARTAMVPGPPAVAVRNAVLEAPPDLLVLGWHRHLLRHPWLAHPTAWQLSRSVPVDVLIVDLTAGRYARPEDSRPGA